MRTTRFPLALAFVLAALVFTPTPTRAQSAPPPPGGATPAEICTGGIDEDGDTLTDCADSDCTGDAACATPASGGSSSGSAPAASPAPAAGSAAPAAPGPAAASTPRAKKATDPAALALRWGAVYDPATKVFSCTVPAGQAASGQNCWSPGYETGKKWDWDAAPARYSRTLSRETGNPPQYLFKGGFYALEVMKGLVADHATAHVALDEAIAKKADASVIEGLQTAISDIEAAQATRDTEVGAIKADLYGDATSGTVGLIAQVGIHEARITAAEADNVHQDERLDAVEDDVATLKGDMGDVKIELREMPRSGLAVEAGLQASAGNPVTNGEEGDELAYRRIPYGLGLSIAATLSVCSSKASCFLLQGGVVLSPRDAGGTGFGAFGNVGGEFRIGLGLSVGPLLGYQWRGHGLRNGGSSAQSSEAAFGLFLRAALPIEIAPAVPGVTFALQGLAGTSRHDPDSHGRFEPEASYGVLVRAAFSIGTPLRRTRIAD